MELDVEGRRLQGNSGNDGNIYYNSIPAGYPIEVMFVLPYGQSNISPVTLELKEGETVNLDIPAGRFIFPWIAPGSSVSIREQGELYSEASSNDKFISPLLPVGTYTINVKGKYPFTGIVTIKDVQQVEVPGYRESILSVLSNERENIKKSLSVKKAGTAWGGIFLGIGLLGAASTAVTYSLGVQAANEYAVAKDTATIESAREKIELYQTLFPVSAAICGTGLFLSLPFFSNGSNQKALQQSIDLLNKQISALGGNEES